MSRKQTLQTLTTNSQSKAQASNTMTHPHKDLIIAWANGAKIQCKDKGDKWFDVSTNSPLWNDHLEYRIKPQTKTAHFALYYDGSSHTFSEEIIKTNKLVNIVTATFDNQGNLLTIEKVS